MNRNKLLHHQYVLLYHGYINVSSYFNSYILEQKIKLLKKESPSTTTVSLDIMDFNIVIRTSHSTKLFSFSYSDFCDYVKTPTYVGMIFKSGNFKKCYIFSIDSNLNDHLLHDKYNFLFKFKCSQINSLYGECDQFPTNIEQIIESTNFFRNVLSDDFMGCTNDEYDTSIIHEEFPVSRQKRKFEDGSPLCQLLAKRPSLGETLSGDAVSPYNDCYYDDNSCNKEDESNHASSSATDLFYKTIGDNLLRKPFMEYLEEQFCQENLIFYVAVQEYRLTHNDDKRIILGKQIVRDHLEDDSPDQINIDNRTRTAIIQKANQENYNIELFDCAQFQITEMMKFDIWPRYLKAIDSRKMTTINKNPEKPPFVKSRLSLNNLKNKLFGKKSSKTSIETANYIWNCKNPHRKEDRFSLHFDTIGKSFRSAKKINIEKTNGDPKFERNNSLSSSMSIKHLKSFHKL